MDAVWFLSMVMLAVALVASIYLISRAQDPTAAVMPAGAATLIVLMLAALLSGGLDDQTATARRVRDHDLNRPLDDKKKQ